MKEWLRTFVAMGVSRLPKGILTDQRFFELYQSRGWHATPVHFYQPVPDTRDLPETLWETPSALAGIDINLEAQVEWLDSISSNYLAEFHAISDRPPASAGEYTRAIGFSGIDGAILYSMIRKFRPNKIIEIGSGYSTLLTLLALRKNAEERPKAGAAELIAIEPYPSAFLRQALKDIGKLVSKKVQDVPVSEFEKLKANDILFIDSSHTVTIGSDVIYEILEILPRLNKGVLVHFHDIFLPAHYPKEWVKKRHIFWTEQYLLQAFLAFNACFEIIWSAGCMQAYMPAKLSLHFPYFTSSKQQAGSFWIKRNN